MRLARGVGKGRRHHQQVYRPHGTIKLGKAQVVADRQPDAPHRGIEGDDLVAVLYGLTFIVVFGSAMKAEQVDLVVARHAPAGGVEHQAAVAHLVRHRGLQGNGAAHQPDLVAHRRLAQEVLQGAGALLFPGMHLVHVVAGNQGEVLRQCHQLRAARGRFGHQAIGVAQVLRDIRPRHHLHRGNAGRLRH